MHTRNEYWAIGLAAVPPLKFELIDVNVGVDSVGILYRSFGRPNVSPPSRVNDSLVEALYRS